MSKTGKTLIIISILSLFISIFTLFWPSTKIEILKAGYLVVIDEVITDSVEGSRKSSAFSYASLVLLKYKYKVKNIEYTSTSFTASYDINKAKAYYCPFVHGLSIYSSSSSFIITGLIFLIGLTICGIEKWLKSIIRKDLQQLWY